MDIDLASLMSSKEYWKDFKENVEEGETFMFSLELAGLSAGGYEPGTFPLQEARKLMRRNKKVIQLAFESVTTLVLNLMEDEQFSKNDGEVLKPLLDILLRDSNNEKVKEIFIQYLVGYSQANYNLIEFCKKYATMIEKIDILDSLFSSKF